MIRRAVLRLDGWSGPHESQPVDVVDETPTRYRIRAITETRLAGRYRFLEPGKTALVPRRVVRFLEL